MMIGQIMKTGLKSVIRFCGKAKIWVMISVILIFSFMVNQNSIIVSAAPTDNWINYASTSFEGGSGTSENPYQITTAEQLAYLAKLVNSGDFCSGQYFRLTSNISLNGHQWTPIGCYNWLTGCFDGIFDGNGNTILGLTIGSASTKNTNLGYAGLFGDSSGIIENLSVSGTIYSSYYSNSSSNLYAWAFIGVLVGDNYRGTIKNCSTAGSIVGGKESYIGGLAGSNENGSVLNCHSKCTITDGSGTNLGGLVGDSQTYYDPQYSSFNTDYISIKNCFATGNVTGGDKSYVGGLVGLCSCNVANCYAIGNITTCSNDAKAGGLIGLFYGGEGEISFCYAKGNVRSAHNYAETGGFIGCNEGAIISNCYAAGNVSTGNIKTDSGGFSGWNFSTITNCYATGNVSGGDGSFVGGFSGHGNCGSITNCYATGNTTGGSNSTVGGFIGYNDLIIDNGAYCTVAECYWNNSATQSIVGSSRTNRAKKLGTGTLNYNEASSISETIGIAGDSMKSGLATTLNRNISLLKLKNCVSWKYVSSRNKRLPVLTGVGDGA